MQERSGSALSVKSAVKLFSDCRDYFEFDRDRRGQRGHFDSRARWIRFAVAGEIFGVEFVIGRKVFLASSSTSRTFSKTAWHCFSMS